MRIEFPIKDVTKNQNFFIVLKFVVYPAAKSKQDKPTHPRCDFAKLTEKTIDIGLSLRPVRLVV